MTSKLTMQVVNSAVGNSEPMAFETLNQASAAYRAFCLENGFGASEAGRCMICQGGRVVAEVSYNGKVWAWEGMSGKPSTGFEAPIYDPYAEEVACAS